MASSTSVYGNSPSAILSAHQYPPEYFHDSRYRSSHAVPYTYQHQSDTHMDAIGNNTAPPTPSEDALAGRKRCRGDDLAPDDDHLDPALPATPISRGEPVYGPGMTLMYPQDASGHYNTDAGSQSGTWVEERMDAMTNRPKLSARKSMRMGDGPSTPSTPLEQPAMPTVSDCVVVNEAARVLGISWTRLDCNENNMIKQRAFTRWISRHYPFLRDVELWFENCTLPGYLGKAYDTSRDAQGYYLWSFDLHQAILVSRQSTDLVLKLREPHISLSQAAETIRADLEPVIEATAQNAAILHNDRFADQCIRPEASTMDVD